MGRQVSEQNRCDLLVVGGGINGAGIARDAAGRGLSVILCEQDDLASHTSWASEMKFPFALASDPQLAIADKYGSHVAGRPMANRTVFVIGKDGKITWSDLRFNALSEPAYDALKAAVAAAK